MDLEKRLSSALDSAIGPGSPNGEKIAKELRTKGFAVLDNFWGSDLATMFYEELKGLREGEQMLPNKTEFLTSQGAFQTSKPNIYELDLHIEDVRTKLPLFDALFRSGALSAILADLLPDFKLQLGTRHATIKLQCNDGGAFPLHYDNPAKPNKRKLTCLTYLNPDWKEGDGGEICMQPFMGKEVVIQPLFDRVVFFLSEVMLHRVRLATTRRYCFTVWVDGEDTNSDAANVLRTADFVDLDLGIAKLQLSPAQRMLARLVYPNEFEASIRETMAARPLDGHTAGSLSDTRGAGARGSPAAASSSGSKGSTDLSVKDGSKGASQTQEGVGQSAARAAASGPEGESEPAPDYRYRYEPPPAAAALQPGGSEMVAAHHQYLAASGRNAALASLAARLRAYKELLELMG